MSGNFSIILEILKNKYVISVAVVCFLLMDFASYVCSYRKKTPRKRIKKFIPKPEPTPSENDAGEDASVEESE